MSEDARIILETISDGMPRVVVQRVVFILRPSLVRRYLVGGFILSSWSCRSAGGCIYYARIMALSECLWLGPVYNTIFYLGYWAHN